MQGLVDVGRMGCLSLAANIHQSKEIFCPSEPLSTAFHPGYQTISTMTKNINININ
jgi:hypothetical protein